MSVWVYSITSTVSDRQYIGITVSPRRRWLDHLRNSQREAPRSLVALAIKKYGRECFAFVVIYEAVNRREADAVERGLIASRRTLAPHGYNLTIGGDRAPTRWGFTTPPETRAKMSAAALGKRKSPEHVESMRRAMVGRRITSGHVAALARGREGKVFRRSALQTIEGRIRRREEAARAGACRIELCNGTGPWRARISLDGKTVHLGLFSTEAAARLAYRIKAAEHLAELYAERERLVNDPEAALEAGRADRVTVPRRDRAQTLRANWADPRKRACLIAKISKGKRRGQKTDPAH